MFEGWEEVPSLLHGIAESLWRDRLTLEAGLSSGLPGAALYLGHLSRRPGFESWRDRSRDLLEAAVERIGEVPHPALFGGYVGTAWAVAHLNAEVYGEEDEASTEAVDEALLEYLDRDVWAGDYDLIGGLVGLGVYALEGPQCATKRALVESVLGHLERMAVPAGRGVLWPTPAHLLYGPHRGACPEGCWNLGLAHGVPGVLAFLGVAHAKGMERDRTRRLYTQGMMGLRIHVRPPSAAAFLPAWVPLDGGSPTASPTRIAWCYGDLGASVALLHAARRFGREEDEALALDLGRMAAARPMEDSRVMDACLCHGSAGNAHLFHRLYLATGEEAFRNAAHAYAGDVLRRHSPEGGAAGFTHFMPAVEGLRSRDVHEACPGVLEGAAGIGLALLSLIEGTEPTWDRFMLVA